MSRDSWTGNSGTVQRHVFPEHRAPDKEPPEWMRSTRNSIEPAYFGETPKRRMPAPEPQPELHVPDNLRVDPLEEARAALADDRRTLEAEREALALAQAELDEERGALAEAAASINVARQGVLDAHCEQLAEVALAVVQAIITDAFDEAPERATALARAALKPDESATLRVGPALHIALLESGEASSAVLDASLPPYGCIAESSSRRVVAGLEERLGEVLRVLKEAT